MDHNMGNTIERIVQEAFGPGQARSSLACHQDVPEVAVVTPAPVAAPVEGSCAFVCDGTCGAILDRPFICGDAACSRFMLPLRTNPVIFVCRRCASVSPQGPRMCCDTLCDAHIQVGEEKKRVLNVSQLPSVVCAKDCGPHIPPFNPRTIPPLLEAPRMDTEWANRHVLFTHVVLQGASPQGTLAQNHVVVYPGQSLKLSFNYSCSWRFSPNDYCPGCVIQWYVGMRAPRKPENHFCINLIQRYYNGQTGRLSEYEFTAPTFPGVYYITTNISLDYHFVPVGFSNDSHNSIAVVQVAYFDKWSIENHRFLPAEDRRSIEFFARLGGAVHNHVHRTRNPMDCPCRLGAIEGPVYSKIFSFLGPFRD